MVERSLSDELDEIRNLIATANTHELQRELRKRVDSLLLDSSIPLAAIAKGLGFELEEKTRGYKAIRLKVGQLLEARFPDFEPHPEYPGEEKDAETRVTSELPFPVQFELLAETLLPSDDFEVIQGEGPFKKPSIFPRTELTLEVLEELGVGLSMNSFVQGVNSPNMVRKLSYRAIAIPLLDRIILVCDEEGNRTFVVYTSKKPENFYRLCKSQLKELMGQQLVADLVWCEQDEWKMKLKDLLTGEPPELPVSTSPTSSRREKPAYLSFSALQAVVQAVGITSRSQYKKARKAHPNWPAAPHEFYKRTWTDWYDFSGKERPVEFLSYSDLRATLKATGIISQFQYIKAQKAHPNWPSTPEESYGDEWINWYDFLGKEKPVEKLSLADLKIAVQAAGITTQAQYNIVRKDHPDWPSNPYKTYKEEWADWYDFLGKAKPERPDEFLSFSDLKAAARIANIRTGDEYYEIQKNQPDWPSSPRQVYGDEWTSWYDFLGKEKPVEFLSLADLKAAVQSVGVAGGPEYNNVQKAHPDWPSSPYKTYDEWTDWYDFLGKEKSVEFLSFSDLKVAVRAAGITSQSQYKKAQKAHPDWPGSPNIYFDDEWTSLYDFLGKEKPVEFLSFSDLKAAVQAAGITSFSQYNKVQKSHPDWPATPERFEEWTNWYDFFGKEKPGSLSFSDLKIAVQAAGITKAPQYLEAQKAYPVWPSRPDVLYAVEWTNWYDFLGREKPLEHLSFADLKIAVHAAGVTTQAQYNKVRKNHPDWPAGPHRSYADEWTNWYDFFGKEKPVEKLSFTDLKSAVQASGVLNRSQYRIAQKSHPDWPSEPFEFFSEEWTSWYDLFGKEKPEERLSFTDLKAAVKAVGIINQSQFNKAQKDHPNWPSAPSVYYGDEWTDWYDFLGKEKPIEFLSFADLKAAVEAAGIISQSQYKVARKSHPDWPAGPHRSYADEWTDWYDFLGKK